MTKKKSVFDRVPQRTVNIQQVNAEALVLLQQGQFQAGADLLQQSLAQNPRQPEAHYNLGFALHQLGLFDAAIQAYSQAHILTPRDVDTLMARGHLLAQQKRLDEAARDFSKVVELAPNNADAWNNLGNSLIALEITDRALCAFDRALSLSPGFKDALFNKAVALQGLGNFDAARRTYASLLEIAPDFSEAKWHLSWIALIHADFEEGWRLFESRWQVVSLGLKNKHQAYKRWDGVESLRNKVILLHAEQGLGDTLQFCRYVNVFQSMGAKVLLEVQPSLVRLVESSFENVQVFHQGAQIPAVDFQCPMMSLPFACKTIIDTVPNSVPYLRAEDHGVVNRVRKDESRTNLRVGLVWSGNPEHKGDFTRSIPLSNLAPLLQLPNIEFICLQPEVRKPDEMWLTENPHINLRRIQVTDFFDTAMLVDELDLVITVDTAVAHLAGGMGKPTWILLPKWPDYRWLLEREDSPWYPTARLFRQNTRSDWAPVVNDVVQAITDRMLKDKH